MTRSQHHLQQKSRAMAGLGLRDVFSYDPATGTITWKIAVTARVKVGDEAGQLHSSGYRSVHYKGRRYQAHRVAWFLVTGEWPRGQLDHKNLDKADNRWGNLREADPSLNAANRRPRSRYGKGVCLHPDGRFQAQIKRHGRTYYLGLFDTAVEASAAYAAKAKEFFGDFARTA